MEANDAVLSALASEIGEAERAVALTGAGVSVPSGIPPFRGAPSDDGPDPVWESHDPADFHRRRFDADPEGFWTDRLALRETMYGGGVEPNAAHEALAALEARGHLDTLLTQNVDGLHAAAGSDAVVELHGTSARVVCDRCGATGSAGPVRERVRDGERPPTCDCGGVLKPDVVLFGEPLPDEAFDRAQTAARRCDVFLAVGSSLTVRPAALLPEVAAESGATLAVCNLDATDYSERADYDLRADATEALPALAAALDG
ncbi:Sir2-type histone deacetylase [Halosimplex carlsbadense 2-9-1]|uniref:Sir2-type histone deacetylase n=1 Tax=Halosimplex carlsbadense 2-9-1 TaxID=797114 RepID=M0CIK9_9EURY|nr:Sir2 family NAD-dependent protein deacetylase [Halosimplex carlsbadense]ELZ22463.1 Sir2-type histone deacetylase [Halosimplex carlsbadense 2-9-1]